MSQLSPVIFHGDTIFCIDYQNQPFTPMRPIVHNMGLDWASQSVKLNSNKERWGVVMIATPSDGGEQKMLSMPVRKLPAWLNSINPKKVRPELRDKIIQYQNECDDVLWDYWMNVRRGRPVPFPDAPLTPDQQCTLQALVKAKIEALPEGQRKGRGLYPQIWSRFNNHFRIARYCQLPQCRLSEAITYLTQMELAIPRKEELPAAEPIPSVLPGQALPPSVLETMTASQRARRFRKVLEEVHELAKKVGTVMSDARIWMHPGGRLTFLPPELNAKYNALDQMHKTAIAGLYQAEHMLYCLYFLGEGVDFTRR